MSRNAASTKTHFGVDAKKGEVFAIPSDPKFASPTFEAVIARTGEIGGVFVSGMDALSRLMARQLLDTLASKTRPAP